MIVGFIGPREPMTKEQMDAIEKCIAENYKNMDEFHHRDIQGADDYMDTVVRLSAEPHCKIVTHPSKVETKRAFVENKLRFPGVARLVTHVNKPRPSVLANCDVVESVDVLIVAAEGDVNKPYNEVWAIYRYAKKIGKTVVAFNERGNKTWEV